MYDADYDNYLNDLKEEAEAVGYTVKDSGKKAVYSDGNQRDDPTGKPKFALMWPKDVPYEEQLIYRVAMHYMHGGQKYGDRNWEKSSTKESLAAHEEALWRHFTKFYSGVEDGEDHAAAIVWNINAVLLTRRNIALKAVEVVEAPDPNKIDHAVLLTRRNIALKAIEVVEAPDPNKIDLGDGVTMDIDPSELETPPEWAKHSVKCCSEPVYSSIPFTLNDSCGKGLVSSTPLGAEHDIMKSYTFPYIGKSTASTGRYEQKEVLAETYADARRLFDSWYDKQPHYNAFPDMPAPKIPLADLEWSEGDVLEENRESLDGEPYCWVYKRSTDTWKYKVKDKEPAPESARSLKKLVAEFGPLTCTKGSHTGRVVDGT